ncbi:DUF2750 domain-containing protein [Parashewanella spongiae]|uniref:DUF2750 domain-containing protein n=1 Tax=Parashewanella spongiae TaxID=342950 RepID=UPI001FB2AC79|nr:DUF2750 domain-containing protein [Parashewanella spongiae]MCL1079073.1 DUF2750 domain-containing protein [Parashewanella spongiae]
MRYCADFENVWGLSSGADNWIIYNKANGDEVFPLWPHLDLAKTCCYDEHLEMGATPQSISLEVFIAECIPDMNSHGVKFVIFSNSEGEGVIVDGLKAELEYKARAVWE